jgi:hypothetical protein
MILRGLGSSYRFYDRKYPVEEIIFLSSHTGQICVLDNIFKISWKLDPHPILLSDKPGRTRAGNIHASAARLLEWHTC